MAEFSGVVWRHKGLTFVVALPVVLATFLFGLTRPPVYEAEARLMLTNSGSGGVLGDLAALTQAPAAAAEIEIIRSRMLVEQLFDPDRQVGIESATLTQDESDTVQSLLESIGPPSDPGNRLDDIDRLWALPPLKRKLLGQAPATGRLDVRLLQWPSGLGSGTLDLHFQNHATVDVAWRSPSSSTSQRCELSEDGVFEFDGVRLQCEFAGEIRDRHFRFQHEQPRPAIENLLTRLSATETERGSGIIHLSYFDHDPDRAAHILNDLLRIYVLQNRERLTRRTRRTSSYVQQELEALKSEMREAGDELVKYQEGSGALNLPEMAAKMVEQMALIDAERAQIEFEIHLQQDLLTDLEQGSIPIGALLANPNLDPATSSMIEELLVSSAEESVLSEEFTDKWPALADLNTKIDFLERRIASNARAKLASMKSRLKHREQRIEAYQGDFSALPETVRRHAVLKRRYEAFEKIYTYLQTQLQEAKVVQAATVESVDIIDLAVPPLNRISPNLVLTLLISLGLGLAAGVGAAFARESNYRMIQTSAQLEAISGIPSFGVIPDFRRGRGGLRTRRGKPTLPLIDAPTSVAAESYRSLRASIRVVSRSQDLKTLSITSAGPGEGKSSTLTSLAVALAQSGAKTLIVDADLRRPTVHKLFHLGLKPGLGNLLEGKCELQDVIQETNFPQLSTICAGSAGGNPGDLLSDERMLELVRSLRARYDFVLFDVPPVLAVADAAPFLTELDGVLFLCRAGAVPEEVVLNATRRLRRTEAELLGTILNGVPPSSGRRGEYSAYGYEAYASEPRASRGATQNA